MYLQTNSLEMKNLILSLILMVCGGAHSQNADLLYASDISKARAVSDRLLSYINPKTEYKMCSWDKDSVKFYVIYGSDDKVLFEKSDMDYHVTQVGGSIDALFIIWSQIDSNANKSSIQENEESPYIKYIAGKSKRRAQMIKDVDGWKIETSTAFY